jgi:hypothetical protein
MQNFMTPSRPKPIDGWDSYRVEIYYIAPSRSIGRCVHDVI